MTEWIDISQPLTNDIAHWPEDTPFHYETTLSKQETGSVNIGQFTTSAHMGTHTDAPFHYLDDGKRILDLDINRYIGSCKVIDIHNAAMIDEATLKRHDILHTERLLIKTSLPNNPVRFPETVPGITQDGAAYMEAMGVKLVGVDTPSVDPIDSKHLPGHHALYQHDIYIVENLMLDSILEGDYELVALPLALAQADGSPVRAAIKPIKVRDHDEA